MIATGVEHDVDQVSKWSHLVFSLDERLAFTRPYSEDCRRDLSSAPNRIDQTRSGIGAAEHGTLTMAGTKHGVSTESVLGTGGDLHGSGGPRRTRRRTTNASSAEQTADG